MEVAKERAAKNKNEQYPTFPTSSSSLYSKPILLNKIKILAKNLCSIVFLLDWCVFNFLCFNVCQLLG